MGTDNNTKTLDMGFECERLDDQVKLYDLFDYEIPVALDEVDQLVLETILSDFTGDFYDLWTIIEASITIFPLELLNKLTALIVAIKFHPNLIRVRFGDLEAKASTLIIKLFRIINLP